jgi:hypothetical protein
VTVSGMTFTTTMDPENIKAILATNFKDFGIGHRLPVFGPLFGSGIFTTDGAQWEHSRVCLWDTREMRMITDHVRLWFDQTLPDHKLRIWTPSKRTSSTSSRSYLATAQPWTCSPSSSN